MATARRGGLDLLHEGDDGRARQRGGDGDSDDNGEGRREKYNLLHEGFSKLRARHTVVLVYFAQEVGIYIYIGRKIPHIHVN